MGSFIELNDTLQITTEQGFPADILDLKKHKVNPIQFEEVKDKVFSFYGKPNARIYHLTPTRCFLVHNIDDRWLYWGKIFIIEQTIKDNGDGTHSTSGKYKIIELYDSKYQEQITRHECPEGRGYFE